jgi:hypothetical protein
MMNRRVAQVTALFAILVSSAVGFRTKSNSKEIRDGVRRLATALRSHHQK